MTCSCSSRTARSRSRIDTFPVTACIACLLSVGIGSSAKQHAEDRLRPLGVGWLARDQVEVGVRLDHSHDHVRKLVGVDGEVETPGVALLAQQSLDGGDKARL